MKWFYNMKISQKLITSFIIIALITSALISGVAIVNIKSIDSLSQSIYKDNLAPLGPINRVEVDFLKVRINLRNMALSKDTDKSKYVNTINDLYKDLNVNLDSYSKYVSSEEEGKNLKSLKESVDKYNILKDKIANCIIANKPDEAVALMNGDGDTLTKEMDGYIANAFDINMNQAKVRNTTNTSKGNTALTMMIVISLAAIVLSILISLFIARIIGKPINKLVDAANSISKGNLDVKLEINTKDEIGILAQSFEKTIEAIRSLVTDANMLSKAAIEGKLSTRADASKHGGEFGKIVEGVNSTLDSVIEPLDEANQVLYRISLNDLTMKMNGKYNGVLKDFADSINNVHTSLTAIQNAFVDLSKGDISKLEEYKKIGKRSENDKMLPSIIVAMTSIKDLINEVRTLANFATKGDLSSRGNAGKFEGGYKEIIEGMNSTIDAVVQPIQEASAVLQEMAKGDLRMDMNGDYRGEYAKIKDNLNLTLTSFNDILNDINNSSQQVASGSSQVSDGSQALSQGSTEQASSIEELSSAITQISAQTKQNAINASQANELAENAKENAAQGNTQMKDMLKAMVEINESSNNISKIIKVIDEIAFQTNILALNAAVEAARAGQHGKGFAVVAEEVRNLAERSANAAKETTAMIEGSIKKVEAGTKIANETAEALNKIVIGVEKASNLVADIATASNEQATGISQINKGIEQVSTVVQTNSATAEESAAASEELTSQAQMLREMIGKFKLKRTSNFSGRYEENTHNSRVKYEALKKVKNSFDEVATTSSKPVIALSDSEFGKY